MSWPALNQSYKAIDLSVFNGGPDGHPIDLPALLTAHPDIDIVIVRCMWPSGVPDPWFSIYYDDAKQAGKMVGAYAWPNPHKSVEQMVEDRKAALDGRLPDLLAEDVEDFDTVFGVTSKTACTAAVRGVLESDSQQFPKAEIVPYCRGYNWDEMILNGSWVNDFRKWIAHWIFPPYLYRQAYTFEELDKCLPVSNNFTPAVGTQIDPATVIGWQASSQGLFDGVKGRLDFGYWLRSACDEIWQAEEPVGELFHIDMTIAPQPIELGLLVPSGSNVTVSEQAG